MSSHLSDANHSLQQTLTEVKNIVTAASATIDEAQRAGDDEKVKSQFENAENSSKQAIESFEGELKGLEEKLSKDGDSEQSVSARVKQIVRTFQDGLDELKKEVLDKYPEKSDSFVSLIESVGKTLESFLGTVGKATGEDVKSQVKLVQKTLKDLKAN